MNRKIESVWRLFADLPPEAQQQVADFIAFLRQRRTIPRPRKKPKCSKLADDPFIGMWRDRKDLQDSTAWIRKVRESEWMKHRG